MSLSFAKLFTPILVLFLCVTTLPVLAGDAPNVTEFDVGSYTSEPVEIKKALITSLLRYEWKITDHQKRIIVAEYKGAKLIVAIDGNVITIKRGGSKALQERWVNSIKSRMLRELEYTREINRAIQLEEK